MSNRYKIFCCWSSTSRSSSYSLTIIIKRHHRNQFKVENLLRCGLSVHVAASVELNCHSAAAAAAIAATTAAATEPAMSTWRQQKHPAAKNRFLHFKSILANLCQEPLNDLASMLHNCHLSVRSSNVSIHWTVIIVTTVTLSVWWLPLIAWWLNQRKYLRPQ